MVESSQTCWTVVRGAAQGEPGDCSVFARLYEPVVRAYLASRWRNSAMRQEIDDAVQNVFVDCFRQDGALSRCDAEQPFRPFLYGVIRIVAMRAEARSRGNPQEDLPENEVEPGDDEGTPSQLFDQAWAQSVMEQAAARQAELAALDGQGALQRLELLELRFGEGLPIREIAERWKVEPDRLHRDYARARREFHAALREVVRFHHPGSDGEVDRECRRLLDCF